MPNKSGKVVDKIDPRSLPAFGGRSASKKHRDANRKEAAKRARMYKLKELAEKRKKK